MSDMSQWSCILNLSMNNVPHYPDINQNDLSKCSIKSNQILAGVMALDEHNQEF